jgi:hypothetical protein
MMRSLRSQRQNTRPVGFPAPVQGLYANQAIYDSARADGLPDTALWLYNMVPREKGLVTRLGSREFATNIPGVGGIRTIIYYNDQVSKGSGGQDYIFAATQDGIFDITAGGAGPWTPVQAWPSAVGDAGWCSFVNFTNDAGTHYLLVCDEVNGYYTFDGTTWAAGTFSGPGPAPDPANVVQVSVWQNRIFFTERDTSIVWYTDPGAIIGDVTPIEMGTRFIKGGHLVGTAAWTFDDGAGLDDRFVAVSSSGDMLVFGGFDPASAANWSLQGIWYIGEVPEGRRIFSNWGGDLAVLSTRGVANLAYLTAQASLENPVREANISAKIDAYLRPELSDKIDLYGWQLELHPTDDVALVLVPTSPTQTDARPIQFALNTTTNAWCVYRDLDMNCANKSNAGFLFGTRDGRVMEHTGNVDEVPLAQDSSKPIIYSVLTNYAHLGEPIWKRVQFIRPAFIADAIPSYSVQARYDFDLAEVTLTPPGQSSLLALWDSAIWDTSLWTGTAQAYTQTIGSSGMGYHVAVALRGESYVRTTLLGFDLMLDAGGML